MKLVAVVTCLVAAGGTAGADPLRPAVTNHGWQVDIDSLVQIDAVPYAQASENEIDPATLAPLNEETIDVRRALVRLTAHKDDLFAELEMDADNVAGPTARLIGAYAGWFLPAPGAKTDPPLVTAAVGLMIIPFGSEVATNVRDKTFLEVPTWAQALFPGNFDGGAQLRGAYGMARWVVAALDGAPSGDLQWKGRDPDSSYDLMGRLGGVIDLPHLYGRPHFEFGVSALTGKGLHPGTPPTKDQIVWDDMNNDGVIEEGEIIDVPGSPGQPSVEFSHSAIGADASARWCLEVVGSGVAFGEIVASTNLDRGVVVADPVDTQRDLRELGFSAGVLQDVTAWAQIGARYDRYDSDRDAQKEAGVVNVRLPLIYSTTAVLADVRRGTAKLIVEYDHRRNPLGVGDTGLPSTRADDRLAFRAQVQF
jgi:hypothetical protein